MLVCYSACHRQHAGGLQGYYTPNSIYIRQICNAYGVLLRYQITPNRYIHVASTTSVTSTLRAKELRSLHTPYCYTNNNNNLQVCQPILGTY